MPDIIQEIQVMASKALNADKELTANQAEELSKLGFITKEIEKPELTVTVELEWIIQGQKM